jgi:hypothetical protein
MQTADASQTSFAETVAERLFDAERRLRAAVQQHERTQPPARYTSRVELSPEDGRTILRAILPATLALGRTRRATLRLHGAVGSLYAALVDVRDPSLLDPAIAAAVELADALANWIEEARWRQATRKAGVAWARLSITSLSRQSIAPRAEHQPNETLTAAPAPIAAGPAPKRRAGRNQVPGQGTILLPIAGDAAPQPQRERTENASTTAANILRPGTPETRRHGLRA